jgi:lipoic acid synthetase
VRVRRPRWLKVDASWGPNYRKVKSLLSRLDLHTVCQEANCPNVSHCFEQGTATFLILGDVCTRGCKFCDVRRGVPSPVDDDEPRRVAKAVKDLGLSYAVITSVTRDDLPDGGARIFAATVREIRSLVPACQVEVLVPDFGGSVESLTMVLDAKPDVLNHNLETVRSLYPKVRKGANYDRSLELFADAKRIDVNVLRKSGIMVGLGESWDEILDLLRHLRQVDCQLLTIGQYLSPSDGHVAIEKFYHPEEFAQLKKLGEAMGFAHVESGPLVRSSYHAKEQVGHVRTLHEA